MKKFKVAFLVNRSSGGGEGRRVADKLPGLLRELGLSREQYYIQSIGEQDALLQTADLSRKAERLVAIGGDGTAATVIAGVHTSDENIPVGIVPLGTGNDLARIMGLYRIFQKEGLQACLRCCLSADAVPVDIWRVNQDQLLVNYLSIGVDAAIVSSFCRHRRKGRMPHFSPLINRCIYALLGITHAFTRIQGDTILHLERAGQHQTHHLRGYRELVISNISHYAGGNLIAPEADHADRQLNITSFSSLLSYIVLFLVQPVPRVQEWYGKRLTHYRGERIRLSIALANYLQIDGEDKTYLLNEIDTITIKHAGQVMVIKGA